MSLIKQLKKTKSDLANEQEIQIEWDSNVKARAFELENKLDRTYFETILPLIDKLVNKHSKGYEIIDVGCGLGYLTDKFSNRDYNITGIDISQESIIYAKNNFPAINFINSSIAQFSLYNSNKYDLCIANMVFHNCTPLQTNIQEVNNLLKYKGALIVTIPHPAFWFKKHGGKYMNNKNQEVVYKIKFKINGCTEHPSPITFIQRSLSVYLNTFIGNGFKLIESIEPSHFNDNSPNILILVFEKV